MSLFEISKRGSEIQKWTDKNQCLAYERLSCTIPQCDLPRQSTVCSVKIAPSGVVDELPAPSIATHSICAFRSFPFQTDISSDSEAAYQR
jgi:hypothetical protein